MCLRRPQWISSKRTLTQHNLLRTSFDVHDTDTGYIVRYCFSAGPDESTIRIFRAHTYWVCCVSRIPIPTRSGWRRIDLRAINQAVDILAASACLIRRWPRPVRSLYRQNAPFSRHPYIIPHYLTTHAVTVGFGCGRTHRSSWHRTIMGWSLNMTHTFWTLAPRCLAPLFLVTSSNLAYNCI